MRLIALLSWYDEPRDGLLACIQGLARMNTDLLVALDGAYDLYPDGKGRSELDQHGVLAAACAQFGIDLLDYTPSSTWEGNEVAKRTELFRLGWGAAQDGDWFFVVDGDEQIVDVPDDLRERLEATDLDAAEITMRHLAVAETSEWPPWHITRRLYRAQRIHVETNHWTYKAEGGRTLWIGGGPEEVPALDLSDLRMDHNYEHRSNVRHSAKLAYHEAKFQAGAEFGTCEIDGCEEQAITRGPKEWKLEKLVNGAVAPVSATIDMCEQHARETEAANDELLREWGIDPAAISLAHRYPVFPTRPDQDDKSEKTGLHGGVDARWVGIQRVPAVSTTTSEE